MGEDRSMRIVLVRHGQTPSNIRGLLDTAAPGPGLTDLGLRQAAAIPSAFRDRPVEAMAVSTLLRTHLTAAPLAEARSVEPTVLDGLREIEAGENEMLGELEAVTTYLKTTAEWAAGKDKLRMPGGESGTEFFDRFDAALEDIASTGAESVALVSHGAAIRTWGVRRARGAELTRMRTPMSNTGFIVVEGNPKRGWDLIEWCNDPAGGAVLLADGGADPTAVAKK